MGHRMLSIAFFPDRLRCHGNEIWDKIGYNLLCVRDICEIFASKGGFVDGPPNAANRIFPRLTLVAMGTKFGTKWDIIA